MRRTCAAGRDGGGSATRSKFFLFYVIGLLALIGLSVLAFSTLGIQKNVSTDLAFIQD
jgi:hypothetical protein